MIPGFAIKKKKVGYGASISTVLRSTVVNVVSRRTIATLVKFRLKFWFISVSEISKAYS